MKQFIIFLNLAILLTACGGNKENNPEPITPPTNGSDPKPQTYVVKTIAVNIGAVFSKRENGILSATLIELSDGAGNTIQLNNNNQLYKLDAANIDQAIVNANGGYARASFPKYKMEKKLEAVIAADSAIAPTIKVKGFSGKSFNQINYILVEDGTSLSQTIGFKSITKAADLSANDIQSCFSGKMAILSITIDGQQLGL